MRYVVTVILFVVAVILVKSILKGYDEMESGYYDDDEY